MSSSFSVDVSASSTLAVLRLHGDIDRDAHEPLEEAWRGVAAGDVPVLLEFSDVEYINSTGIALIVGLLARARAERRRVSASGLSDHYREIFEITRLSDFLAIYDDEQAAALLAAAQTERR